MVEVNTEETPAGQVDILTLECLSKHGWTTNRCGKCHTVFFQKGERQNFCRSDKCMGINIPQTELETGKTRSVQEVGEAIKQFYLEHDYVLSYPLAINNKNNIWGNTSLIVSGVQRLTPYLLRDALIPEKVFINQPCVRTQFRGMSKEDNWSSSAFINPSVLNPGCPIDEHFVAVGSWIDCLAHIGIDMNQITITTRREAEKWGECTFTRDVIDFHYYGLHITDAGYVSDLCRGNSTVSFSDIGGGLERLTGILNGGHYYAAHTLQDESGKLLDLVFSDTVKALTLVVGSGVTPSNKDAWQHVKRYLCLFKKDDLKHNLVDKAVLYYIKYWEPFVNIHNFGDRYDIVVKAIKDGVTAR